MIEYQFIIIPYGTPDVMSVALARELRSIRSEYENTRRVKPISHAFDPVTGHMSVLVSMNGDV